MGSVFKDIFLDTTRDPFYGRLGGGPTLPRTGLLAKFVRDGSGALVDTIGVFPKQYTLPPTTGTVYYVDSSRPDNTGNGLTPETAKQTISGAYSVASNGDTIYLLPGTYSPSGLGWSKSLLVLGYNRQSCIINASAAANNFTFNAGGAGSRFVNFTIGGTGATGKYIFENAAANNVLFARFDVADTVLSKIVYNPANTISFSNFLAKGGGGFQCGTSGTIKINFAEIFECADTQAAVINNTGSGVTIINKSLIIGGNVTAGTLRCSGGSLTANNCIIVAPGEMTKHIPAAAQTGGTLTINNSLVLGPANQAWTLYSGTVVRNNVVENVLPMFLNRGKGVGIVTLYTIDSNVMTGGVTIDPFQAGADRAGVHVTAFIDDSDHLPAEQQTRLQQFVAAGHEAGCTGNSSSRLDLLAPMTVQYTGADTNCTLTIASGVLTVTTTEGNDNFGPWSLAKGGTYSTIGVDLITLINLRSGFVAELTAATSYDDAYSIHLADGVYDLSVGTPVEILWDMDAYLTEEIPSSKAYLEAITGKECKTYFYAKYTYSELAETYIRAAGFESAWYGINGYINLNNTGNVYAMTHEYMNGFGNLRGTGYAALDAAGKELRIRGSARAMAETIIRYGVWESILIPTPDLVITEDEVYWFCDELVSSGVMVLSFEEAIDYIKSNGTGTEDSYNLGLSQSYVPDIGSTSPCINAGTSTFSDGDGDQYDSDENMIWSDTFDAPVYSERSGVDIGPHTYGSGNKVYNHPINVSGSGLTGTYTLPICPTLYEYDDGSIYTGIVPNEIDLSTFVDTDQMRWGSRSGVFYSSAQDAATIIRIDLAIGN